MALYGDEIIVVNGIEFDRVKSVLMDQAARTFWALVMDEKVRTVAAVEFYERPCGPESCAALTPAPESHYHAGWKASFE